MYVISQELNLQDSNPNPLILSSVGFDDPLQGTICRPFPLYATFFYRHEILLMKKTKPVIFTKIFHALKRIWDQNIPVNFEKYSG
jgi:hypothetical protein